MKKAQDLQKKYPDQNQREVTFAVGDRFGKVGKLAVRYIWPYQITGRVGEVAYQLELPPDMKLHPVFHVSMHQKHVPDPNAIVQELIRDLQPDLTYPEGPLSIGERRVRKLKNREIPQIQVFWGRQNWEVITWDDETRFKE
ncbi:uncharacterized protein LOC112086599 [Eutrema salsugineum]|uniref:uncharacterized protein LOC112086599 n=1 Tax=Eutrema salsugineum TaxID=72664 RepID=UPI000CED794B|nr:uncharacterized protein LOC112086599 [Eutrema salsugineum]